MAPANGHETQLEHVASTLPCPQLEEALGVYLGHMEEVTNPVTLVALFQPVAQVLTQVRRDIHRLLH